MQVKIEIQNPNQRLPCNVYPKWFAEEACGRLSSNIRSTLFTGCIFSNASDIYTFTEQFLLCVQLKSRQRWTYRSLNANALLYDTEWWVLSFVVVVGFCSLFYEKANFNIFQRGFTLSCPYAISFLSYCSNENHIQIAEEITLIFAAFWTLIHTKCKVMCRKTVMNSVSHKGGKILLEKKKEKKTMRKERRESWRRKERGTQKRKMELGQLKFPPRAPNFLSPE